MAAADIEEQAAVVPETTEEPSNDDTNTNNNNNKDDTNDQFIALDSTGFVKKRIIEEGSGEPVTRQGASVNVHYTGSLYPSGEVFDSSLDRGEPLNFKLGEGMVIKGWDVGIASMRLGEKAELLISPEYGYGERGSPPKIPSRASLLFSVELVSFDLSSAEKTVAEKLAAAAPLKNDGNTHFKAGNYNEAKEAYLSALQLLEHTWEATQSEAESIKSLQLLLNLNLAQVFLKSKESQTAIKYCEKALKLDPKHPKAVYRLSQAYLSLFLFDRAVEVLDEHRDALSDIDVDAEIVKIRRAEKAANEKERQVYKAMFSK
eukprot:jgi/Hompol1/4442/HPOL_000204-RA